MYILVMETSTSSAKVLLYNKEEKTYQVAMEALHKSFSHGEGRISQHNAKYVFEQTLDLARSLITSELLKQDPSRQELALEKIVYVTTWHSMVFLDREFSPLSPVYLWSYKMEESVFSNLLEADMDLKESYEAKTGCNLTPIYPFWKLYLSMDKGLSKKVPYIGDQSSYGMYQLTGQFLVNPMMASGSGFYNLNKKDYDDDLLKRVGINRCQLPTVVDDRNTYKVHKQIADYLHVSSSALVCTSVSDGGMNQIYGEAVLKKFSKKNGITISVGTSGAIRGGLQEPYPYKGLWCYELSDHYVLGGAIGGAGNILNKIKDSLFPDQSFEEIEKRITNRGLMTDYIYLPFDYGERNPGFFSSGPSGLYDANNHKVEFDKLKEICYKSEACKLEIYDKVYLALMEGVAFNLYQCFQLMEEALGDQVLFHLSGGIIKSRLWSGLVCNLFGYDMLIDRMEHASLFGGLIKGLDGKQGFNEFLLGQTFEKIEPDLTARKELVKRYIKYKNLYKERRHV